MFRHFKLKCLAVCELFDTETRDVLSSSLSSFLFIVCLLAVNKQCYTNACDTSTFFDTPKATNDVDVDIVHRKQSMHRNSQLKKHSLDDVMRYTILKTRELRHSNKVDSFEWQTNFKFDFQIFH